MIIITAIFVVTTRKSTCKQSCKNKLCNEDNNCGQKCGCPQGNKCMDDGSCCSFEKNCKGKQCGSDGCGGFCGSCPQGNKCMDNGTCCPHEENCKGKQCGSDGCGGSCGTCPEGNKCMDNGTCCLPLCTKPCVDNGCGDVCPCPAGTSCSDAGECVQNYVYGLPLYGKDVGYAVATSFQDCETQAVKAQKRFWTYDSNAQEIKNCTFTNNIPVCSLQIPGASSGDILGQINPNKLPQTCPNTCVKQPDPILGNTVFPILQPGCGTDSGIINALSYGMLDPSIGTDSCTPNSKIGDACTSSLDQKGYNFSLRGKCAQGSTTVGGKTSYYMYCNPLKGCANILSTQNASLCVDNS